MDKWTQLDSLFNKKNRHIQFKYNIFNFDENKNNTKIDNPKLDDFNYEKNININLKYLIHPIDDDFDEFIEEKIKIFEKLKGHKYQSNDQINNNNEEKINFNIALSKYKKEEESIIKSKNEPILILDNNKKDLNIKDEFNIMKSKKYFFNKSTEDISTELGRRNKLRLNNILNKIKKEKPKKDIISIPNMFNKEKSFEENKDYFDSILKEIKIKK